MIAKKYVSNDLLLYVVILHDNYTIVDCNHRKPVFYLISLKYNQVTIYKPMNAKGRLLIIGGHEDRSDNQIEMKETNAKFSPYEILKLLTSSKNDRFKIM